MSFPVYDIYVRFAEKHSIYFFEEIITKLKIGEPEEQIIRKYRIAIEIFTKKNEEWEIDTFLTDRYEHTFGKIYNFKNAYDISKLSELENKKFQKEIEVIKRFTSLQKKISHKKIFNKLDNRTHASLKTIQVQANRDFGQEILRSICISLQDNAKEIDKKKECYIGLMRVTVNYSNYQKLDYSSIETFTYDFQEKSPKCLVCGKWRTTTQKIEKCSKCLSAYYCGVDCQRLDWPKHRLVCKFEETANKNNEIGWDLD